LLATGVKRVILGTMAVENPELVRDACRKFREAVILGLDARKAIFAPGVGARRLILRLQYWPVIWQNWEPGVLFTQTFPVMVPSVNQILKP